MTANNSNMHFRPRLEAEMISSCLQELLAATALAVAMVSGLVNRIRSSAVALRITSSELSKAWRRVNNIV